MKTKKILLCLLMLTLSATLTVSLVYADASGSSVGTATITSATPTISNVELWNAAEDIDKNNTALDSNNVEYHLNFTVTSASPLSELDNATIIAWDNRGQAEVDADSQRYHYTWTWIESTDTWACPLSASYIDQDDCEDPGTASAAASYEFRLSFKLSKVANYSNGGIYDGWQFKIYVYNDDNEESEYGQGTSGRTQFGVASFLSVTIADTTHSWAAAPNTNNNAITSNPLDSTVIANRVWKVQVKANQTALNGTAGSINVGNVTQYGSNSVGDSAPLTTDYADVTGLTAQAATADEAAPSQADVYLWLDVPNGQASGEYIYALDIQVATG